MPQDHPDGTVPMQITGADKKLPTDWQDQYVGVFLKPDWEAKENHDKSIGTALFNQPWMESSHVDYTVPAGKTLYITDYSFTGYAANAADADVNQSCMALLQDLTAIIDYVFSGANGGGGGPLSVPIVIPENHTFRAAVYVTGNHNMNALIYARGYEV